MSILYFPDSIKPKLSDLGYKEQDTLLTTDMDFGTHTRITGSETVISAEAEFTLTNAEYGVFMEFMRICRGQIFYMKHPDHNYPNVDKTKYYAFNLVTGDYLTSKIGNHSYLVTGLVLNWHFRIQGIDRI